VICERCGALEVSEDSKIALADLAERISNLFSVQPDITSASTPDGLPARSFGIGFRQRANAWSEKAAIDTLVGNTWERFQRAFGEQQKGRKAWWRSRPVVRAQGNYATDSVDHYLWMRLAIEDLTEDELTALRHIVEPGYEAQLSLSELK
jgi:hypothetical protein